MSVVPAHKLERVPHDGLQRAFVGVTGREPQPGTNCRHLPHQKTSANNVGEHARGAGDGLGRTFRMPRRFFRVAIQLHATGGQQPHPTHRVHRGQQLNDRVHTQFAQQRLHAPINDQMRACDTAVEPVRVNVVQVVVILVQNPGFLRPHLEAVSVQATGGVNLKVDVARLQTRNENVQRVRLFSVRHKALRKA